MSATAVAPAPSTNGAAPKPTLQEACDAAIKARSWVYSQNVESNPLIDLLMLSAIAQRHGFIVGEGGTGKSKVVRDTHLVLPGAPDQKFVTQFRKDMDTQAIFGPIAVSGLMNDEFRHVLEGFLATALWGYADEFRDASTMILRSLLMVMNERQFPNGRHLVDVPLRSLIGTTNFWHTDPETAALMDRFAWRYIKQEVESEAGLLAIVDGQIARRAQGSNGLTPTVPPPVLTLDELDVLTHAANNCDVPIEVRKAAVKLKTKAANEGLHFSVRRLGEGFALGQALATLCGRTSMIQEDLIVLQDVIASDPDDVAKARELCADFAGQASKEANLLRKTLSPLQKDGNALKAEVDANGGKVTSAHAQQVVELISKVNIVIENVEAKIADAKRDGSDTGPLDALHVEANNTGDELRSLAMRNLGGRR